MHSWFRHVQTLITGDDGKVALELYLRTYESGKEVYGIRVRMQKRELAQGQVYVKQSLKTNDYEKAVQLAHQRYADLIHRQNQNINIKATSVEQAIDSFLTDYSDKLKKGFSGYKRNVLRNQRKSTDLYWREYIGKKNLEDLTSNDMDGYEEFRRSYAKNTKRIKNRYRQQYKDTVSTNTLIGEINYFKQFLRWCAQRGLYSGNCYDWNAGIQKERNRREAFSIEQYRTLVRYMRTTEFFNKGPHKAKGSADSRIKRHRHMLRAYILFMANTGLRVGEARHLKWKDVSGTKNRQGDTVCVVSVDNTLSKVTKGATRSATVVGRLTAWKALERWKDYLISIDENVTDEKFIFCNDKGKAIQHFREGFDAVITEAGVDKDRYGNKFVIYTLRHTYITFRLKYGKNVSIHSLAKNARTSVEMIQSHYDDTETLDFVDELTL
jgi:integrase